MALNVKSLNIMDANQFLIDSNYNYDVNFASPAFNKDAYMYDWLTDSKSTNHITGQHNLFSSYEQTLLLFIVLVVK